MGDAATVPAGAEKAWIQYEGGPKIDPAADPLSSITDAVAIQILPAQNAVRVIGFEDYFREPLRSEYFYSALNAYAAGSVPAISIDPRRPTDPPGSLPVRYEGLTAGSRLGGVLFESDRVMKTLAMAADNISGTKVDSGVSDHAPVIGGTSASAGGDGTLWRLWIEPDRWHVRNARDWVGIIDARMSVKWELMSGSSPSAAVARFAETLTNRYFAYAQEQPAFYQLDQASAVVAMGRFAWESGVTSPGPFRSSARTPSVTPLRRVELTRNVDL